MADAISIEETNKIRIAIGLPPLPVPGAGPKFKVSKDDESSSDEDQGSTLESRQAQGYDNWKKLQEEHDAKAKREAKNEAIKKARDAARKYAVIEGKGLGEADEAGDVDAKAWLKGAKKRQKKLQEQEKLRKLEQELADRENAAVYTAEDLAGVKVGHEVADFEEGDEQVLTLKDTTIDQNEEEGDEIENLELREQEARNERLELKKRKPVYDPHAANEEGGSTLLKHYDETIDGKKRKRFTLDGQGATAEEREAMKQAVGQKLKAQPISLDILKNDTPISDYNAASEAKIRKPKKKKAKTRQRPVDEDDIFPVEETTEPQQNGDAMEVDAGLAVINGAAPRPKPETTSFVDDDDLQASLAKQRRVALKKRKRTRPEDLARQLREEASATPGPGSGADDDQAEEGGLVIDETTEFVANLQRAAEEGKAKAASTRPNAIKSKAPTADDDDKDIDMDRSYNDIQEGEDLEARIKRETSTPAAPSLTETGLEDEATLNQGLGATLNMLSQRGLIKKEDQGDINALHRKRQAFIAEKQKREAAAELKARQQRERDRASGRLDRMSAREREEHARWENKQRDQQESRQMAEIFNKDYKPDVQLKYVDEFGRSMNQKEAFKHLSHQFHGKGSGKQKTEKHLKKIEDDKKREAQSSLDASQATGMNNAMGATAKKNRQAGVRLA
ncbi:hypothetical protein G7Y79_00060g092210 [Physcia stellaris]|nr:hypothetical protein G7Y79_00060g092210 [Physcia stellaris]